MYIVTSLDKSASGYKVNAFAALGPERGVLPLLCGAARRSRDIILTWLAQGVMLDPLLIVCVTASLLRCCFVFARRTR